MVLKTIRNYLYKKYRGGTESHEIKTAEGTSSFLVQKILKNTTSQKPFRASVEKGGRFTGIGTFILTKTTEPIRYNEYQKNDGGGKCIMSFT